MYNTVINTLREEYWDWGGGVAQRWARRQLLHITPPSSCSGRNPFGRWARRQFITPSSSSHSERNLVEMGEETVIIYNTVIIMFWEEPFWRMGAGGGAGAGAGKEMDKETIHNAVITPLREEPCADDWVNLRSPQRGQFATTPS